ncbi:HHE domain protein [Saccharata proteae CBS 121410]|uniref:HHE domain protein n=1 Tax=Saccharata proteae CBS 121410 TaxID=1314787 RepID=A0A9P4HZ48_9PEZI|nr:HHE domain protein [Saccharata proteae CBS 121410]
MATELFHDLFTTPTTSNPSSTLAEAIGADHDYFDVCASHIRAASTLAEKTKWRNQLTWVVARHAISEELTWYPAMEKHMGPEGKKLADEDREQHQAVKNDLSKIQDMSPDDPAFDAAFELLMTDLHTHIEHEKKYDMPKTEALLSRDESKQLAAEFQRTKMIVPTRSHPEAPNAPPLETLAGLMYAPMDKLKDLMRTFPSPQEGGTVA